MKFSPLIRALSTTGVLTFFVFIAAGLTTGFLIPTKQTWEKDLGSLRSLTLTASGDVEIVRVSEDQTPKAVVSMSWLGGNASPTLTADDGRVELGGTCSDKVWPIPTRCDYSARIELPQDASIVMTSRSGDVNIQDIDGPITVNSFAGDITVKNSSSDVTVETTAGDVALHAIGGDVSATTTAGDISCTGCNGPTLTFRATTGDVNARIQDTVTTLKATTVAGGIDIEAPSRSFDVDGTSVFGRYDESGVDDPDSQNTMTLRTTAGDITIKTR